MGKNLYIGVDLGTSFIKAGAYDLEGCQVAESSSPVRDERPAPGVFIQRGDFLYEAVVDCLKNVTEKLGEEAAQVKAIAFTGQMAGSMGVGDDWEDITTWSCTLDSRFTPYAEQQRELFGEDMFQIGGTSAPVMCSKYAWFKQEFPQEHKKIRKYVMLNGYMIGRLAEIPVEEAAIDYSLITWTGMSDIKNRSWSEKICSEIGMERDMLPKVVSPTTICGYLADGAAAEVGLPKGLPLVAGAGDKVAGCTGAGIFDEGEMIFEAASYGAISVNVRDVRLDHESRNYDAIGAVDDQSYYLHKYIQGSGISTDWFVNTFFRTEGMTKKEAFARAEDLAQKIGVGSDKLMAIGLLGGSSIPFNKDLKGMFLGHTWMHHAGHFYHALMESFSYDLALTLNSIMEKYPQYADRKIKLIGGGAKSSFWPQMLADVTGHTFQQINREDAAMWGAALLAAKAVGDVDDLKTYSKKFIEVKKEYVPDPEKHEKYQPYVQFYKKLMDESTRLYRELEQI